MILAPSFANSFGKCQYKWDKLSFYSNFCFLFFLFQNFLETMSTSYAGGRTDFERWKFKTKSASSILQAQFCKLYPADFSVAIYLRVEFLLKTDSGYPKDFVCEFLTFMICLSFV